MKNTLLAFLLLLACAVSGQSAYWEKLNPPDGGWALGFTLITNGWVYAELQDHSVYCSKNNGQDWEKVFSPSIDPDTGFQRMTVGRAGTLFKEQRAPSLELFSTYISNDNGQSWQLVMDSSAIHNICQTSSGKWFGYSSSEADNKTIFYASDDQGSSWNALTEVTPNYYFNIALIADDYDRLVLYSPYSVQQLTFSSDEGQTWHNFYDFQGTPEFPTITLQNTVIRWDILFPMAIIRYVADTTDIVVIDTALQAANAILSHVYLGTDSALYAVASDPATNKLFCYRSVDDGSTWTFLPNDTSLYQLPVFLRLSDGSLIASLSDIYRSADDGSTWFFSTKGIQRGRIEQFESPKDSLWYATTSAGLWKTANSGTTWGLLKSRSNLDAPGASFATDLSGKLLVCIQDSVFFSTNFGTDFSNVTPGNYPASYQNRVGINPENGTLFLGTPVGTQRSSDGGQSWSIVTDSIRLRKLIRHPSGLLYAAMDSSATTSGGVQTTYTIIYKSTDDGITWSRTLNDAIKDFTINALGEVFAKRTGKLFRSIDNGNTWSSWADGLPNSPNRIASNMGSQLFLSGTNNTIAMSVTNGNSWQTMPPNVSYNTSNNSNLSFDPSGKLYAPTHGSSGQDGLFRTTNSTLAGAYLTGEIFKDADGDCSTKDPETTLHNWVVRADGVDAWYANTDTSGRYTMFLDTGAYFLSSKPAIGVLWQSCGDSLPIQLAELLDTTTQDFPILALADCPYMTVDVSVPWLERCFESQVWLEYCNQGTQSADSVWVDLMLDPLLTFTDTLLSYESLGNNTFRFQLGAVNTGDCGSFSVSVYTDCDSTVLGQTLCVEAHIYPDSLCIPIPGWSGAEIALSARCEQDTVYFDAINQGDAPTQPLLYYVIEDDVVMFQNTQTLLAGESRSFAFAADGHYLRFESEQEPGHPFSLHVAAWEEGCGDLDLSSLGFVNQYFVDNGIPAQDVECTQIIGSFDPNDKQGFPLGFGPSHLVEPNTEIEYLVRFQNTGTASAHHVVVRDTLSALLDPATIRMGPASHPFSWSMDGQGFLSVSFSDINLPDSNANEMASHGFFSFKIAQKKDLPLGSDIFNVASIYFDFNGAVRTNETQHRIGKEFITFVATETPASEKTMTSVSPNPVGESAVLTFKALAAGEHCFLLRDAQGRVLRSMVFQNNTLLFRRESLASGVYFYQIVNGAGNTTDSGKLLLN